MSRMNLFRHSGVPKTVLANGLGRFIPQCQRITLKFCKSSGPSRGMRDFIENDVVDFAKNNPNVVVYLKPRRFKTPVIVAEYLNGERKWISCKLFTKEEISKWLHLMVTQSGQKEKTLLQYSHTNYPSIQGPWTPFYNKEPELNCTTFPQDHLFTPKNARPTATEELIEIFKKQQEDLKNSEKNEMTT